MNPILFAFQNISIRDLIDILLVIFVYFSIFRFMRETRAQQLMRGIALIFVFTGLANWFKLYTIAWLLNGALTMGVFALLIVFQPELRRGLESLGRRNILQYSLTDLRGEAVSEVVEELIFAIMSLSRQKIGALIVIERNTGLSDIVESGTLIDGHISSELLINIFIPNTPLHDGAVIIKDEKIRAASCFLPLTEDSKTDRDLGTRHRAALGISEVSDALAIVVSEETGGISYAERGKIARFVDIEILEEKLTKVYTRDESGFFIMGDNDEEV